MKGEGTGEDSHQLTKKWAFIIYSFEMQKQGGRYRTYPTKPSSLFPPSFALKGLQGSCEG